MSDVVDKAEAWDAATAVPPKALSEIERLRAVRDQAAHLLLGLQTPCDTTESQRHLAKLINESVET